MISVPITLTPRKRKNSNQAELVGLRRQTQYPINPFVWETLEYKGQKVGFRIEGAQYQKLIKLFMALLVEVITFKSCCLLHACADNEHVDPPLKIVLQDLSPGLGFYTMYSTNLNSTILQYLQCLEMDVNGMCMFRAERCHEA